MAVFDSGMAPQTQSANVETASVPRSAFNMSRIHHVTGLVGALMPIDVMETLPNEDYTLNYACMVETRNPLFKPLKSGMKIIFHSYYQRCRNMWEGWDNFIDRGRSGTHVSSVPKLYPAVKPSSSSGVDHDPTNDLTTLVPMAPSDYMGIPIVAYDNTMTNINHAYTPIKVTSATKVNNGYGADSNNTEKWGINALPFVMYNQIYRDYYANQNLLQENKSWFPDNEAKWILPYTMADPSGYTNEMGGTIVKPTSVADFQDANSGIYVPTNDVHKAYLNALHFRQFRGDYFNTANPFADLLRGDKETLNINMELNFDEIFKLSQSESSNTIDVSILRLNTKSEELSLAPRKIYNSSTTGLSTSEFNAWQNCWNKVKMKNPLNLNQMRKLAILEKFMQRNACTNGTYKEFINAQFGYMPNVQDRKPIYIGGSTQDINFNAITQTGATNGTDIIGQKVGQGASSGMNGIGKFHSDDYGYIMTIACIVPDVYYNNQGLETMWTRTEQDEMYYPLLNNLEPQPILNKEIFVSGDKEYDEDVWGYANRFEDMKSRRNIISGLAACGNKAIVDSQGFVKRTFDKNAKPVLNPSFLTMSPQNIDLVDAGFTSANEPPFDLTIGCIVDKVSPMPYTATPCDLGIKF